VAEEYDVIGGAMQGAVAALPIKNVNTIGHHGCLL